MTAAVIGWLLAAKSNVVRWLSYAAAGVVIAVVVYWRIFTAGKRAERIAQDQQSLRNLRTRQETHDEIATRPVDARRNDLGRWVQPD